MKNVMARVRKAVGITNQIISILEEICFGPYHFEVAVTLRNALFISSVLCNSEAWYNISNEEINKLEQADEILLRRTLECPSSTPKEMLYLELNCLPIRFLIMSRRVNFLWSILAEDPNSLMHKFLKAQLKNPNKNDWGQTVLGDLEYLEMDITISEIAGTPKEKSGHSKVLHI